MKFEKNILVHKTPLHIAVLNPHIEIIKFLLDQEGINANEVDEVLHIIFIQFLFSIHDFFSKIYVKSRSN